MTIDKLPNKRGTLWSHRHNPAKVRGDNCYERRSRARGARGRVLDRICLTADIEDQVGLYVYHDEELDPPFNGFTALHRQIRRKSRPKPRYLGQCRRLRKNRKKEELRAMAAEEHAQILELETKLIRAHELLAPYLPRLRHLLQKEIADLERSLLTTRKRRARRRLNDRILNLQVELIAVKVAMIR
jgi:hypothetical protein